MLLTQSHFKNNSLLKHMRRAFKLLQLLILSVCSVHWVSAINFILMHWFSIAIVLVIEIRNQYIYCTNEAYCTNEVFWNNNFDSTTIKQQILNSENSSLLFLHTKRTRKRFMNKNQMNVCLYISQMANDDVDTIYYKSYWFKRQVIFIKILTKSGTIRV